jgi:hypothetical protein
VKDENFDMLADSFNVLSRWKNYSTQLLNMHNISDVGQIEVHIAEKLIRDCSPPVITIAVSKYKKHNSSSSD